MSVALFRPKSKRTVIDFASGIMPSYINFTRASNATDDSSGLLLSYNTDQPRFSSRGLLIERSRTNLSPRSNDFADAYWAKDSCSVAVDQISPDGTTNATTITENGVATLRYSAALAGAVSTTYTASFYVKRSNFDWLRLTIQDALAPTTNIRSWFNLNTGVKGSTAVGTAGFTIVGSDIYAVGNGWYRISFSFTTTGAVGTIVVFLMSAAGDGNTARADIGSGAGIGTQYIVYGHQLGGGSFASSYVPTTTASLTRAVDLASLASLNNIGFNATEGTFIVHFSLSGINVADTTGARIFQVYSDSSNRFGLVSLGGPGNPGDIAAYYTVAGVNQFGGGAATTLLAAPAARTTYKVAYAYKDNDLAACINGGSMFTDSSATMITPTAFQIGNNGYDTTAAYIGWIQRIEYYPTRLPNNEMQARTA